MCIALFVTSGLHRAGAPWQNPFVESFHGVRRAIRGPYRRHPHRRHRDAVEFVAYVIDAANRLYAQQHHGAAAPGSQAEG